MTSARTSQGVSGAASGAAMGYQLGGPWGAAGGAVVGGIAGLISGGSADAQFENQQAWAQYNARTGYETELYNINMEHKLSMFNANASLLAAGGITDSISKNARYNMGIIGATSLYNFEIQNQELRNIWVAEGLELEQLDTYRRREKGAIIADQAASGTLIEGGSNQDIVIGQQAQRELDKTIIMYNADKRAAGVMNQMAQGLWQGQVAMSQTLYEGDIASYTTRANAAVDAASSIGTSAARGIAGRYNAEQRLYAGQTNIDNERSRYSSQNTQNLIGGLFGAGSTAISAYYNNKTPGGGGTHGTVISNGQPTKAGSSLATGR